MLCFTGGDDGSRTRVQTKLFKEAYSLASVQFSRSSPEAEKSRLIISDQNQSEEMRLTLKPQVLYSEADDLSGSSPGVRQPTMRLVNS